MRAITLHAPYATLCVTRQPCDCHDRDLRGGEDCGKHPMVSRFITSDRPCPPSIIGQRIAIHQAKRNPDFAHVGEWTVVANDDRAGMWRRDASQALVLLPLGVIVGSATITASLPIVEFAPVHGHEWPHVCLDDRPDSSMLLYPGTIEPKHGDNISDQLPYGDWTPGRYAWLLADAAPTTERCPWCWGTQPTGTRQPLPAVRGCPACDGAGRCDPIPATGRQGWWNWEPSLAPPPLTLDTEMSR